MVDAVRLNVNVERGAQGGCKFQTTILAGYGGLEGRNADWAKRRGEWTIAYGSQNPANWQSVVNMFHACQGRAYAFLFKDWGDYQATDTAIGTGTGAQTVFQCVKTYSNGVRTYTRTIKAPISATLVIKLNGTPTTAFTLGAGGVITFSSAPGSGVAITATYEFDCQVRFDTDFLPATMLQASVGSLNGIKLVEVIDP